MAVSVAVLNVVCAWAVLAFLLTGVGLLIRRMIWGLARVQVNHLVTPWLGWAATVAFLQIWHLILPVTSVSAVLFLIVGVTGLALHAKPVMRLWRSLFTPPFILIVSMLCVAVAMANVATAQPVIYDSGLYHLNVVSWVSLFPVVPGLGLLHSRLAYNNASLLFVALLDQGVFDHKSHQIANGILIFLMLVRGMVGLSRVNATGQCGFSIKELFYGLSLAPVIVWAFNSGCLSSPTPDAPVFLLGLVLLGELLGMVCRQGETVPESELQACVMTVGLLASIGLVCKVSYVVPGFLAFAVSLIVARRQGLRDPICRKSMIWILVLSSLILIPWAIRGVMLSGYPAYPLSLFSLPVEWRIPLESLRRETEWIKCWARLPGSAPGDALGTWTWVWPWLMRLTRIHAVDVIMPLSVGLAGLVLAWRSSFLPRIAYWVLLIPLGTIVFCLATAPDPRFAGSAFWLIGLIGVTYAVTSTVGRMSPSASGPILRLFLILWSAILLARDINAFEVLHPWKRDAGCARTVPMKERVTRSGLTVYVPEKGDQCWDAPLPCTPYFDENLRLRVPGDLSKGFTVKPP